MNKDVALGFLVFLGMLSISVLFAGTLTFVIATIVGIKLSFMQACGIGTVLGIFYSAFANSK